MSCQAGGSFSLCGVSVHLAGIEQVTIPSPSREWDTAEFDALHPTLATPLQGRTPQSEAPY